jgi:hypothetical protein
MREISPLKQGMSKLAMRNIKPQKNFIYLTGNILGARNYYLGYFNRWFVVPRLGILYRHVKAPNRIFGFYGHIEPYIYTKDKRSDCPYGVGYFSYGGQVDLFANVGIEMITGLCHFSLNLDFKLFEYVSRLTDKHAGLYLIGSYNITPQIQSIASVYCQKLEAKRGRQYIIRCEYTPTCAPIYGQFWNTYSYWSEEKPLQYGFVIGIGGMKALYKNWATEATVVYNQDNIDGWSIVFKCQFGVYSEKQFAKVIQRYAGSPIPHQRRIMNHNIYSELSAQYIEDKAPKIAHQEQVALRETFNTLVGNFSKEYSKRRRRVAAGYWFNSDPAKRLQCWESQSAAVSLKTLPIEIRTQIAHLMCKNLFQSNIPLTYFYILFDYFCILKKNPQLNKNKIKNFLTVPPDYQELIMAQKLGYIPLPAIEIERVRILNDSF